MWLKRIKIRWVKVEPLLELTTLLKAERAKRFGACFTSKSYAKSQTSSRKFLDCLQSMSVIQAPVVWENSLHK